MQSYVKYAVEKDAVFLLLPFLGRFLPKLGPLAPTPTASFLPFRSPIVGEGKRFRAFPAERIGEYGSANDRLIH